MAAVAEQPVIRYTLEHVDLEPDEDGRFLRRFSRTLLTESMPDWLPEMAPVLPDEFAPLRAALAVGDDGSTGGWPLVVLPCPW